MEGSAPTSAELKAMIGAVEEMLVTGTIEPIKDKVLPLIDSAANSYVGANIGWPKRTEACDKSS